MKNYKLILYGIYLFFCGLNTLQAQQFSINGNASQLDTNTYILTPNAKLQKGMVTNYYPLDIFKDFELNFQLNFGGNSDGADGMTFIMTNACSPTLTSGSGMGAKGINNSLIAEFDTFDNGPSSNDIASDHTTLYKNGVLDAANNISDGTTTPVCMIPTCFILKDGVFHDIKIVWKFISSTSQKISVFIDGNLKNTSTNNHFLNSFNSSQYVYWSITAATGQKFNLQKFRYLDSNNSFSVCKNTSITLSAPNNGNNYSWNNNNTSISNTATYTPTINQTVSCAYQDKCHNHRTVSFNLTVDVSLGFTVDYPSTICTGTTANFTINGVVGNSITYSLNNGINQTGIIASNGKLVIQSSNALIDQSLAISKIENSHNCFSSTPSIYSITVEKPLTTPINYN